MTFVLTLLTILALIIKRQSLLTEINIVFQRPVSHLDIYIFVTNIYYDIALVTIFFDKHAREIVNLLFFSEELSPWWYTRLIRCILFTQSASSSYTTVFCTKKTPASSSNGFLCRILVSLEQELGVVVVIQRGTLDLVLIDTVDSTIVTVTHWCKCVGNANTCLWRHRCDWLNSSFLLWSTL